MSGETKPSLAYRVAKKVLFAIFLLFLAIVVFGIGGRLAFIIELPIRFFLGWAFHAWKALPPFFGKWEAAVLPAGCLVVAGLLVHRFIIRWASEKRPALEWRAKHTAAVMSLLFLCSAAAIATSGIFHQFFWLAGGKVIESNRRTDVTLAISNGRQLMLYLLEYEVLKGRYPESFEELAAEFESETGVLRRLSWVDTGDRNVPEPWILLRPGSDEIAPEDEPVIVSPLLRDGLTVVVGFGDMSVRKMPAQKLADLLARKPEGPFPDE